MLLKPLYIMKKIDLNVPETLLKKLQYFAKKELSVEERNILNAVFDVYRYTIENRDTIFQKHTAFVKEIDELENEVSALVPITPTILTLTTLTTTIASHPIIGCRSERDRLRDE